MRDSFDFRYWNLSIKLTMREHTCVIGMQAAMSEFARLRSRSEVDAEASLPQPGSILVATRAKKDIK